MDEFLEELVRHVRWHQPIWAVYKRITSGKRAFGLDPLVLASIWAGTKGPATSPQNRQAAHEALVPARNESLVPV
jgi:hypothetical protein